MRQVGPYDGRRRKTRCAQCIVRKIKCHGPIPCQRCRNMRLACSPPPPQAPQPQLLETAIVCMPRGSNFSIDSSRPSHQRSDLCYQHFFGTYIPCNEWAGRSSDPTRLSAMMQSSKMLREITLAIGMMDIASRPNLSRSKHHEITSAGAYQPYQSCLELVRSRIQKPACKTSEGLLWTILMLSIFEVSFQTRIHIYLPFKTEICQLMIEPTGRAWAAHVKGIGSLIQKQEPCQYLQGPLRDYFSSYCVFEILRTLITGDASFLYDQQWLRVAWHPSTDDSFADSDPRERLYKIMLQCSELAIR